MSQEQGKMSILLVQIVQTFKKRILIKWNNNFSNPGNM